MTGDPALLAAIGRAIRREAHTLARAPELTWPQLHNRLQWEGEAVTSVLRRERRNRPAHSPWLRTTTPFPDAGLQAVLPSPGAGRVIGLAGSPDAPPVAARDLDG